MSKPQARWLAIFARSFSLLGALTLFSTCGLLTAPISVPEAITHNDFLGLKGSITDSVGNPLDDVLVTVKRSYYLWHVDRSYTEFDTKAYISSHTLNVPVQRASDLAFTFHKDGYKDVPVTVSTTVMNAGEDHWLFAHDAPLHVIMSKIGEARLTAMSADTQFDFTPPATYTSIDLARFFNQATLVPADSPPHNFYATVITQPLKTSGPDREVNPLDINLPASITFHLDNPDDGLLPFTPSATTNVWAELPSPGPYPHEFTILAQRLRQLRQHTSDAKTSDERFQFFYFRVAGRAGIGRFSWPQYQLDTEYGRRLVLQFSFNLLRQ